MQMVASVKLNRVKAPLVTMRPYFAKLETILADLMSGGHIPAHPLTEKRELSGRIALCVMASDTGLCGAYNQNILSFADDFLKGFDREKVILVAVGKEALQNMKKEGYKIAKSYTELHGRFSEDLTDGLLEHLKGMFLSKEADEVYIAYTHFESTLRHRPEIEKFLNIEFTTAPAKDVEYIMEPGPSAVMDNIVPVYLAARLRLILLNAFISEHSARMVAMKTATDNAEDLIDKLTMLKNKARQAAITKEVIEIASAVEALRE
jgi:F-type H+-transporting ATPase subunit gamma